MIESIDALNKVREAAQQVLAGFDCRILVCSGTGCIATGSEKIYEKFREITAGVSGVTLDFSPCGGHEGDKKLGIKKTGCQGICELGPLVRIQKGSNVIQYTKVSLNDCDEIFQTSVLGDGVVEQ